MVKYDIHSATRRSELFQITIVLITGLAPVFYRNWGQGGMIKISFQKLARTDAGTFL
ncbi:hypothetical protein CHISP_2558 [Chitinispirillum alkaliphilum]|nr:hypothetical protein CHISP_2558 [Chitinispirillum alkaliphilum]